MRKAFTAIQMQSAEKERSPARANKRAKEEEERKVKTQNCLFAADEELTRRRQERDQARAAAHHLKELLESSRMAYRGTQGQVEALQQRIHRIMAEFEESIRNEEQQKMELALNYQDVLRNEQRLVLELRGQTQRQGVKIREQNDMIWQLNGEARKWANRFASALWATKGLPELLVEAEAMMNPIDTPVEILGFIEFCKCMLVKAKRID